MEGRLHNACKKDKNKGYLRKEMRQEPLGFVWGMLLSLDLKCRRFEHEHVGRKEDVKGSLSFCILEVCFIPYS